MYDNIIIVCFGLYKNILGQKVNGSMGHTSAYNIHM